MRDLYATCAAARYKEKRIGLRQVRRSALTISSAAAFSCLVGFFFFSFFLLHI